MENKTTTKKRKGNPKELENVKKILIQKKGRQEKKNIETKSGFAFYFGWLFALLFSPAFVFLRRGCFFFGSSLCRCRKPCRMGDKNALRNFRTPLQKEGMGRGRFEHVKEQLLKRIYRFIFVCAMRVVRTGLAGRMLARIGIWQKWCREKPRECERAGARWTVTLCNAAISILKFKF